LRIRKACIKAQFFGKCVIKGDQAGARDGRWLNPREKSVRQCGVAVPESRNQRVHCQE
jgi:hypothetical protein